jgi:glycosyltransferase involved in cell wall biosynthesis
LYGNIAARLAATPYIVNTEHGFSEPSSFRGRLKEAILYRFTHKVTVVSENLKGRIQKTYWAPEGKLAVIPNGISIPKPSKSPDEVRMELGMSKHHTNIGIVGRLATVKNHQMLLRAFAGAIEECDDLQLWIVGVGPLQNSLVQLCHQLKISEKVHFLGLREDVPEIMSALDFLVLCSLSEGLSITILEALAVGLPVIATRVGGNEELIQNERNGLLVPNNGIESLRDAISYLHSNPYRMLTLSKGAEDTFKSSYSIYNAGIEFEQLYTEIQRDFEHCLTR